MTGEDFYNNFLIHAKTHRSYTTSSWGNISITEQKLWNDFAADVYGANTTVLPLAPHTSSAYTPPAKKRDTSWNQFYKSDPEINTEKVISDYSSGLNEEQLLRKYVRLTPDYLKSILPKKA